MPQTRTRRREEARITTIKISQKTVLYWEKNLIKCVYLLKRHIMRKRYLKCYMFHTWDIWENVVDLCFAYTKKEAKEYFRNSEVIEMWDLWDWIVSPWMAYNRELWKWWELSIKRQRVDYEWNDLVLPDRAAPWLFTRSWEERDRAFKTFNLNEL